MCIRDSFDTATLANEIKDTEEDVADSTNEAQRDKLARHLDPLKTVHAALTP